MYDNHHMTIKSPKHTNHVLHLILTMATCGAWGFVWVGVAIYNAVTHEKSTMTQQAWYSQPIARPYAVGPGAPVGAMNPHPPTPEVPTPPMPPYIDRGSGWVSATRPPSEPMPPYVGYGPSREATNMANPPLENPDRCLEPGDMLYCDLGFGCDYRTEYGPRMELHKSLPHPPRPQ